RAVWVDMNTVILLTREPMSLARFARCLESSVAGSRVHSPAAHDLVVTCGNRSVFLLASNDTLNDYEDHELEAHGIELPELSNGPCVCGIAFRDVTLLRAVLGALIPEVGVAWVDNDHGVILPIAEFVHRIENMEDVNNL